MRIAYKLLLNTIEILRSLGFSIKSKFIPTQCTYYLGFILISVQMTITLILQKKGKTLNFCHKNLREDAVISSKTCSEFSSSFSSRNIATILPQSIRNGHSQGIPTVQWKLCCLIWIIY